MQPTLTQRQMEILVLALEGLNSREISKRLIISRQTVRNILSAAYARQPEMRHTVRRARLNAKLHHQQKIAELRRKRGL